MYVLFYDAVPDVGDKAPPLMSAHAARLGEFAERGDLLLVGTWSDVDPPGAMSVFRTREAAEEFVAGDPFMNGGVVASHRIREWEVSITP